MSPKLRELIARGRESPPGLHLERWTGGLDLHGEGLRGAPEAFAKSQVTTEGVHGERHQRRQRVAAFQGTLTG